VHKVTRQDKYFLNQPFHEVLPSYQVYCRSFVTFVSQFNFEISAVLHELCFEFLTTLTLSVIEISRKYIPRYRGFRVNGARVNEISLCYHENFDRVYTWSPASTLLLKKMLFLFCL
jgi:hypothetical protein